MKTPGIYRIVNKLNGKSYVGSAVNITRRWGEHRSMLRHNKHHSPHLQNAWNKYGEESFEFDLILEIKEKENLIPWEQIWLDVLNPEYNVCKVAGSTLGRKHSTETKLKIGAAGKGKAHSEQTKAKISAILKGKSKIFSDEHKSKIGAAQKGNTKALGYKHSEEARAKMSAAQKGKVLSEETKAKMRVAKQTKVRATREDGLIIYFDSFKDADSSGFIRQNIRIAIKKGRKYKGFLWEKEPCTPTTTEVSQ